MKLRTKYIVFVTILHVVTLVLAYYVFEDNKALFFASEALILVSLVFAWQLFNQLLQPLQTLMRGVQAIKDRDFNIKFVKTGKHEMDELIGVYNNMIDELRQERTKQEQQHFFLEKLIQTSPVGIIILDHDDKVQQVNPKANEVIGIAGDKIIGASVNTIELPIMQEISSLQPGSAKMISLNAINTYRLQKSHFIDRGFHRSFILIEELTAEILAAEKNAYGKVIRMMAHEVNNTIGPVNSIMQSAINKQTLWADSQHQSLQQALQVAYDRNQNLNIFMRNFADVVRLPEPNKKSVDLHHVVQNVAKLMELKAGEKAIQFIYQLAPSPIHIQADEQQLEQAFINIVKNAIEAIETNGTVTFTTTVHPKKLMIADTGSGIAKEDASELFSPFFSTKKDGQGVGLTLVKQILLNHDCIFSLKTKQPRQTVFEIEFAANYLR
jgi:two-component system, NtrC family, nitrogen regulation sensor histidine kinase NtrY